MTDLKRLFRNIFTLVLSVFLALGMSGVYGVSAEEETEEPEISETSGEVTENTEQPEEAVQETESEEEITETVSEEEKSAEVLPETEEETVIAEDDTETQETVEETASFTEETSGSDSAWAALQEQFISSSVIRLSENVTASADDTALVVPEGITVYLDLYGKEINRNLNEPTADGYVIEVWGTLYIRDTSNEQNGKITGGNNSDGEEGGGIQVRPGGSVTLQDGSVCGNYSVNGGGVSVYGGKFTMEGGSVSNNTAASGGGIFVVGLEGGEVYINGGVISGNTAEKDGGAFHYRATGQIHISGNPRITGNHAGRYGGVVQTSTLADYPFYISGNPVFENNTAGTAGDDIYNDSAVVIDGDLGADVRIKMDFGRLPVNKDYPEMYGFVNEGSICSADNFIISNTDEFELQIEDEGGQRRILLWQKPVIVTYVPDNGIDEPVEVKVQRYSSYTLNQCKFSEPVGKAFAAWIVNGTEYAPGKPIEITTEPVTVTAEWVSVWGQLLKQIELAEDGSVIKLGRDYVDIDHEGPLVIGSDKNITIDLNGQTIDRNMKADAEDGSVMIVEGSLTIKDSGGTGTITGGYSSRSGGGIRIDGGTVVLEGGSITGCTAKKGYSGGVDGGGVYVGKYGSLIINGGSITGNTSSKYGGGIYCDKTSEITMTGGSITSNNASTNGGGIYFEYGGGKFSASGNPVIRDNQTSSDVNNLRLSAGQKIILTDKLSDDALIGVTSYYSTADNYPVVITEGLLGNGTKDNFFSDKSRYFVEINDNDEAVIRLPQTLPEFHGHQLVLSGSLGLKFGMEIPEDYVSGSSVTFKVNGDSQTVDISEAEEIDGRYYFTCRLNTLQMAEEIEAVFHYGNNQTVTQYYTLEKYFSYFDKHEADYDKKTLDLLHAVANYGYYAQPYLTSLHNLEGKYAKITKNYDVTFDYAAIKTETEKYSFAKALGNSDVKNASYKLSLDSDTALSVMVKVPAGTAVDMSASFNGQTYAGTSQSDTVWVIKIPGIKASQLGETITVTGNAGGEFTITVSALSYVRSILNGDKYSDEAKKTVAALYQYYKAVENYKPQ